MINRSVLSCLLLAVLASSLKLEHHQMEIHALTDQSYYQELINLQKTIIDNLGKTQIQLNNFTNIVTSQSSIQNIELSTLENLLQQQRNTIAKVDEHTKQPFPPKPCNVSAETIQNRDALLSTSLQTKTSVESFKKALGACTNCTISSQLNRLILQQ